MLLACMSLLMFLCFSSVCRRVRVDDSLLRPQQTDGLFHHPDLHPLHPDRGPLLGLLLDQERRHASEDRPGYAATHFSTLPASNPHCPDTCIFFNFQFSLREPQLVSVSIIFFFVDRG